MEPENPLHRVLFRPELMDRILGYCDKKVILKCRLVCPKWREFSFTALQKNPRYTPLIYLDVDNPDAVIRKLLERITSDCCLPFRVVVLTSEWFPEMQNLFIKLSPCIVDLFVNDEVMNEALSFTEFPKLRKLLFDSSYRTFGERSREYFRSKASTLVELSVSGLNMNFELGVMKNLKRLSVKGGASVSGGGCKGLHELAPNLTDLKLGSWGELAENEVRDLTSLTAHEAIFTAVVRLDLSEKFDIREDDHQPEIVTVINKSFPNLRVLKWSSGKEMSSRYLAIQTLFATYSDLTHLTLKFPSGTAHGIFRLLTTTTVDEIPRDENRWSDALTGNQRALCGLKNLQFFELTLSVIGSNEVLGPVSSSFLLKAVFLKMGSLRKLAGHLILNDACKRLWRESGRELDSGSVRFCCES